MSLTQRDANQIIQHTHDEEHNANRVFLVNGLNLDTKEISSTLGKTLQDVIGKINFNPQPIGSPALAPSIQTIEVPVIVKQYEMIEKPVYIHETKIVEIEKPVIVEVVKYIEIEKQILVKEQLIVEIKVPEIIREYEKIPFLAKLAVFGFLGMSLLTNIILLIKK